MHFFSKCLWLFDAYMHVGTGPPVGRVGGRLPLAFFLFLSMSIPCPAVPLSPRPHRAINETSPSLKRMAPVIVINGASHLLIATRFTYRRDLIICPSNGLRMRAPLCFFRSVVAVLKDCNFLRRPLAAKLQSPVCTAVEHDASPAPNSWPSRATLLGHSSE